MGWSSFGLIGVLVAVAAWAMQSAIAVVGSVLLIRFKLNPLWLLAGAMVLGAVVH